MTKVVLIFLLFIVASYSFNSPRHVNTGIRGGLTMKIFDWKKRESFRTLTVAEDFIPNPVNLFPIPGSRKKPTRVGRGISAGKGKSCGRGMRGQKSRKGEGKGVRIGFEGGQTPLYRRLPKYPGRSQRSYDSVSRQILHLSDLNTFAENEKIDVDALVRKGLLQKKKSEKILFKIVAGKDKLIAKNLVVKAHAFSAAALEELQLNGGRGIVIASQQGNPSNDS